MTSTATTCILIATPSPSPAKDPIRWQDWQVPAHDANLERRPSETGLDNRRPIPLLCGRPFQISPQVPWRGRRAGVKMVLGMSATPSFP